MADTFTNAFVDLLTARLVDHTVAVLAPQVVGVHPASEALDKTAQKAEDTLTSSLDKARKIHWLAWDECTEHEGVSCATERLEEAVDALYVCIH